jgi:NAD(P)H-quinone oxidoreductase subunit L
MLVAALYLILGGAYLLVMPLVVYYYLKARWYVTSSIERVFMYFLVFLFFPGMLVLAPFLNFRPDRREIGA